MPIRVRCSGCDKPLNVPDKFAGGRIRCPVCDALLSVPGPTEPGERSPEGRSAEQEKKSPAQARETPPGQSPGKSSTAIPDEWLFGDENPAGGGQESTSDEYGLAAASEPPPRVTRKSKSTTFVTAHDSADPADTRPLPRRASATDNLPLASTAAWRGQLF